MSTRFPKDHCVAWMGDATATTSPFKYRPSLAAGIVFVTLFCIQLLLHCIQTGRARRLWQITFILGALSELIGWAARLWAHSCPYQSTPFLMQISTLIFAPAFYTAGLYYILGALIKYAFGRKSSPIAPNLYLYIFFTIDIVSLVMQAAGGGLASSGLDKPGNSSIQTGTNIMVAGIIFQLVSIIVFAGLYAYVVLRAKRLAAPGYYDRRVRWVTFATFISITCVVVRNIFRTVEMLEGWNGYLMTTEGWMIGFDATLMVIAGSVFNVINPGWAEGATGWGSRSHSNPILLDRPTQEKRSGSESSEGDGQILSKQEV